MSVEQTLVLLKPDTVARRLCGEILSRFERKGLNVVKLQMFGITPELARIHYAEHVGKPFYPDLEKYITSGSVIAIVLEGDEAISVVRKMIGATNGITAEAGTIRGDFSMSNRQNLVHASDNNVSAKREIELFFPEKNTQ
ncbi:MAG: nucleoside-diphosphate kinase [Planctomycetaceae bacterium]|jgi:nucleoside-diphosphate kinase|nr:nucleoside-diphosphate kinase [Planctomycetaceae bacterium]